MTRWSFHLRLAKELGQSLNEVMGWRGPMTRRQSLVWFVHLYGPVTGADGRDRRGPEKWRLNRETMAKLAKQQMVGAMTGGVQPAIRRRPREGRR